MSSNIVVITFPDRNATYEAFSSLKSSVVGVEVAAAVIVERDASGAVRLADGEDDKGGAATLGGSAIGMLVGALGGPVGMLLGLSAGALGGALVDVSRAADADDVISRFAETVPAGSNAIVAETDEDDAAALNGFVSEKGGSIVRWPLDEVLDTLDSQEEAERQAADAARKVLREKRHEEHKQSREERLEKLKARFHHGDA